MATCSILGQAVGTAVSVMLADNSTPDNADIQKIQKQLMLDDCFLPGLKREISPITQSADCNAEIVRNGIDRGEDNCWHGKDDEYIEYKFSKPQKINKIRLVFDSNLNRKYQNMPCNHKLVEERFYLPETLIKEYSIILTDDSNNTKKIHINDNHQRLVWHNVDTSVKSVKLLPHKTWGCETFNIFSFELI